jgi:hypothetical protein
MVLFTTIVTCYGPRSGQYEIYVVPLLPAAKEKACLRANHTIYAPAAYLVTFARLFSFFQSIKRLVSCTPWAKQDLHKWGWPTMTNAGVLEIKVAE